MALEMATLDDPYVLLDINNAAVPDVGILDPVKAKWLTNHLLLPGLALLDGQAVGAVVVLSDNCGYDSDYYRWFTDRYENFLYIDRVIVAAPVRGRGVAQSLYSDIHRLAQELEVAIVADVYSEPPNIPSLNFHRKLGFQEVGTQHFPAINKTASKFMKYVERAKPKAQNPLTGLDN